MTDRLADIVGDPDIAYRVREYLLSTPQVDRAAYSMYRDRPLELDQNGDDDWSILPDEWKQEWRDGAREALTGALAIEGVVLVPGTDEQVPEEHQEHVTVSWAYAATCLEGECEHVDENGEPEDLSACPTAPPFEVCVDCMDDEGRGRDPEDWDDVPLMPWPHDTTALAEGDPNA